ncbi:MAG: cytochrome b N-terminal domain-containing protein [Deltaproteobacteria bacterium]|nr:MAG: cytochrome b N-terminal domain-containing protein [Deltaproteobacteria bacterium]
MMPSQHEIPERLNLLQRIWYSIFPDAHKAQKERRDYLRLLNTLVLHFRPKVVQERTLRFNLTWGLGGMALVLVCLLFATGMMLKFAYQPVPDRAYESVVQLQDDVLFGQLVRNIHHWSANILLIVVFLHFLRVFFTGAFHSPRQFNWIIGLTMFLAILGSNFTGYLLPWDQLAFWAVTICTGMMEYIPGVGEGLQQLILGGRDIGPSTLSNFFAIHTAVIPACLIVLMPFHFWRVRKAGGLVVPRPPAENPSTKGEMVATIPNLILRELAVAAVLIALIMLVSIVFDASLGVKANPGLSPNPTKAPWYFAGMQELLLHIHPLFAVVVIPLTIVGALIFLPYFRYEANTGGVWFVSYRGRQMAVVAAVTATVATSLGIIVDEFLIDFVAWIPAIPPVVSNGLLPAAIALAAVVGFYVLIKRIYNATNNEAIQAAFVLLLCSFLVLTIIGIWFRGKGMALVLPWQFGISG